jgi:hypothetical protein
MHTQFLRVKKLTGKAIVHVAARHNLREIAAEVGAGEHIDPARIADNAVLRGANTAGGVSRTAKALMDDAGIGRLRKDAVRALEIIFSLPPDTTVDQSRYFDEATRWAEQHFGVAVLSSIVHRDEAAPHCHVLMLPLANGRMVGSDLLGGKAKLSAMQTDFHEKVGRAHGLARQPLQKRYSAAVRAAAIELAFDVLDANSGLNRAILRGLLEPHFKDPIPLLTLLGLQMPVPEVAGSFVATMTRKTRKEKPIGFSDARPIGLRRTAPTGNDQTLSCVGFADSTPSFPPTDEAQSSTSETPSQPISTNASEQAEGNAAIASPVSLFSDIDAAPVRSAHAREDNATDADADADVDDYVRKRDDDQDAQQWNQDTGEFEGIRTPAKPSNKAKADAAVRGALVTIGKSQRAPQRQQTRRVMRC